VPMYRDLCQKWKMLSFEFNFFKSIFCSF
jgi:hypothetical protein